MRARAARGGQQVRVADNVNTGVRRALPDLGEGCGQLPCYRLDPLLDQVGAGGVSQVTAAKAMVPSRLTCDVPALA